MRMPVVDVRVGERVRQDAGDLLALADSIKAEGLLQPIGITADKVLVFGERRLCACRDVLGWTEIDARVVNVSSIAAGEYAENEMRKQFTPSERVAIADAVSREIGDRRGTNQYTEHLAPVPDALGKTTREIAAERAGFPSATTFRTAQHVVRHGVPEVVDAMDRGAVSIKAAGVLADLPPPAQQQTMKAGPDAIRRVVSAARPENRIHAHRVTYRVPKAQSSLKRLDNAINLLNTVTDGIATLDLDTCLAAPAERREAWLGDLDRCLKDIRHFRRQLGAPAES